MYNKQQIKFVIMDYSMIRALITSVNRDLSLKRFGKLILFFHIFISFCGISSAQAITPFSLNIVVEKPFGEEDFPIVSNNGSTAVISYDKSDYPGVFRAVHDLQNDIDSITGISTIPHFDNVSISKISEIVHNNPDIAERFSRMLINGLLKVKNSASADSRKLIIKEIEMEFEYKLKELEKAHVRLKKDLFKKSNFNVFTASTLSISGFYLEKGFMHFLIPGGYIMARQAMDFLDYYKQKRQLKENEFYFLYALRNQ